MCTPFFWQMCWLIPEYIKCTVSWCTVCKPHSDFIWVKNSKRLEHFSYCNEQKCNHRTPCTLIIMLNKNPCSVRCRRIFFCASYFILNNIMRATTNGRYVHFFSSSFLSLVRVDWILFIYLGREFVCLLCWLALLSWPNCERAPTNTDNFYFVLNWPKFNVRCKCVFLSPNTELH